MKVFLQELGYTIAALVLIAFVCLWPYSGWAVLIFVLSLFRVL